MTAHSETLMKRRVSLAFLALVWSVAITEWLYADTLDLVINNVETGEGMMMIQVMAGEAEYKGEQSPTLSIMQKAQPPTMRFSTDLPTGDYAIRVMHDINGNDKLDSNFVGIPNEPYGFSNNAGSFGPPKWDKAKFTVKGDVQHTIDLN